LIAIICKQFDALEKNLKTNGGLFLTKTEQVTRGIIMDNEDNWALALVLMAVVGIITAILISVFYLNPAVEPAPTSQLPAGYHIFRSNNEQDITVACPFFTGNTWDENVTLPGLGFGGIWLGTETNLFVLNGEPLSMSQNSNNISSFYLYEMKESVLTTWVIILYENRKEWDIVWKARLKPGDKVILPTGERITFVGFGPNGHSLFIED